MTAEEYAKRHFERAVWSRKRTMSKLPTYTDFRMVLLSDLQWGELHTSFTNNEK